jgi:hypothetical protein
LRRDFLTEERPIVLNDVFKTEERVKKIIGKQLYSNKNITDFDVLDWPKVKVITDYRGLKLSKDGYQLEGITLMQKDVPRKFNLADFQVLSKALAQSRRDKHLKCIPPDSPKWSRKKSEKSDKEQIEELVQ